MRLSSKDLGETDYSCQNRFTLKGGIMEANPYQSPTSANLEPTRTSGKFKRRLLRISPLQLGIVAAVFYLIISIPFVLLFWFIGSRYAPAGAATPFRGVIMMFVPLGYATFGFIFAILAAWIYNLVARFSGGIEYTVMDTL